MSKPRFDPLPEWLEETLILAERYHENRGVFWDAKAKSFREERVKARSRKEYVWTSDRYFAERKAEGARHLSRAAA